MVMYLVQQEDIGVEDQCSGDGHSLLLPARESDATLTHHGVVAVLEPEERSRQLLSWIATECWSLFRHMHGLWTHYM